MDKVPIKDFFSHFNILIIKAFHLLSQPVENLLNLVKMYVYVYVYW